MRICAIVPSYNHADRLNEVSSALIAKGFDVLIVDDGSVEPARSAIAALHAPENNVLVFRQTENGGKGAAMLRGFEEAVARGYSHALQIDADGQHDAADLERFKTAAEKNPRALICGKAIYDESVPKARLYGRAITHFWVWVETCSFDIADSMCGFRLYPLEAVSALLRSGERIAKRMDFDTEIAVRLHWRGVRVVNLPTKVIYPPGNTSNFHMLRDNIRISWMHTRLTAQAPFRLLWKALRGARAAVL
jgi:glycosyltransferase involved in cell wall biosynthesis